MSKPTVPEVIPLVREYKEHNPVGGSLHILLCDGNVSDDHVEFCRQWAEERDDAAGVVLANILAKMSKTQRSKLAGMFYGL